MATCSVVFTKISSASDIMDANFSSQEVATGNASTASPAEYNYAIVTPLDGNVWVAFTTDNSAPNTANTSARIPLVSGVPFAFSIKKGTKIGVLDRT